MKNQSSANFLYELNHKENEEWLSILENHSLARVFCQLNKPIRNTMINNIHIWFDNPDIIKLCIELNKIIERKIEEKEEMKA